MAVEEPPKVVTGTVIRTSRGTLLFLCACSGLLAFAAGFVLWDTWGHGEAEHVLPFQLAKDSLHTSFAFVLCVVGGVGCLIVLAYKCLFPHQLVLGDEVLQLIRTGSEKAGQVHVSAVLVLLAEGSPTGVGAGSPQVVQVDTDN